MKVDIILRNVTPYHSSQPGVARVDLDGQFVPAGRSFPCVRTRHLPVLAPRAGTDDERRSHFTPIMPANSLRHALREAMLGPIFEQFRGQYSLSIGAYAAAKAGSPTGNPDGVPATFAEMRQIANHPFFGLFGGGPRMITGKLSVDAAYPITKRNAGLLRSGLEELMAADGKVTFVTATRRVDPIMKFDVANEHLVANAVDGVTAYVSEQLRKKPEDQEEEVKEKEVKEEEVKSRGLNSFSYHEAVMPGVSWAWSLSVKSPTTAQTGLLLTALAGMHGSYQGGMGRIGYGEIAIDSILVDGEEVWSGEALLESALTQAASEAWADALGSIGASDFEGFAAIDEAAALKKQQKKQKKGRKSTKPTETAEA